MSAVRSRRPAGPQPQPRQSQRAEKPPELVAFDTGREVMEQLRGKHASASLALEALCTDIGACCACGTFWPDPLLRPGAQLACPVHRQTHARHAGSARTCCPGRLAQPGVQQATLCGQHRPVQRLRCRHTCPPNGHGMRAPGCRGCAAPHTEPACSCAGARFVPKPEERLLSVVHALLHRCYKLPYANSADIPESLRTELTGTLCAPAGHPVGQAGPGFLGWACLPASTQPSLRRGGTASPHAILPQAPGAGESSHSPSLC